MLSTFKRRPFRPQRHGRQPHPCGPGIVVRRFLIGQAYTDLISHVKANGLAGGSDFRYEITFAQQYDQNGKKKGPRITDPNATLPRGPVGKYGLLEITPIDPTLEETPEYRELEALVLELFPKLKEAQTASLERFHVWLADHRSRALAAAGVGRTPEAPAVDLPEPVE